MNYTPGPWIYKHNMVDSRGRGGGYITRDISDGKDYVCRMDGSTMMAFYREGNAQLISAAPELLEALQKCKEFILGNYHSDVCAEGEILDVVEQAIQKATQCTK